MDKITKQWIKTPSDAEAAKRGCYFDIDAALRVKEFLSQFCKHTKAPFAGKPFELLPWQWERLIAPAFGWKMPDGTRRINLVNCFIPKKNGKSTLTAGLALYLCIADQEYGAEVYLAAGDRNQASIVYNESASMVELSPELESALAIRRSKKTIEFREGNSFIRAIAADGKLNEGYNIHGLIFDELHTQPNRKLWDALRFGGAARSQPMMITISTAGEFDESSLWWEVFQDAIAIQTGKKIDIHTLGVAYYLDDKDDWHDEKTWKKCNPSYGITINPAAFRRDYEGALKSGAAESAFLRYRLNRATKHESAWIAERYWKSNTHKGKQPLDLTMYTRVYGGLDLSDSLDINAFNVVGIRRKENSTETEYATKGIYWISSESLAKSERYKLWAEMGILRVIPGPIAKHDVIIKDIIEFLLSCGYAVKEIGIDRFFAKQFAYTLQAELRKAKLDTKLRLVGYNYTTMNVPVQLLENAIIAGDMKHDNNPITNWMFSNLVCTQDTSGNRKLDKSTKMSKGKIDGFAAKCIAIAAMLENETQKTQSKYETESLALIRVG